MIVEQVWTGNAYRNFNYLIACPETGEALAIDPLDYKKMSGCRCRSRLEHHANSQYARAWRSYGWQQRCG